MSDPLDSTFNRATDRFTDTHTPDMKGNLEYSKLQLHRHYGMNLRCENKSPQLPVFTAYLLFISMATRTFRVLFELLSGALACLSRALMGGATRCPCAIKQTPDTSDEVVFHT